MNNDGTTIAMSNHDRDVSFAFACTVASGCTSVRSALLFIRMSCNHGDESEVDSGAAQPTHGRKGAQPRHDGKGAQPTNDGKGCGLMCKYGKGPTHDSKGAQPTHDRNTAGHSSHDGKDVNKGAGHSSHDGNDANKGAGHDGKGKAAQVAEFRRVLNDLLDVGVGRVYDPTIRAARAKPAPRARPYGPLPAKRMPRPPQASSEEP